MLRGFCCISNIQLGFSFWHQRCPEPTVKSKRGDLEAKRGREETLKLREGEETLKLREERGDLKAERGRRETLKLREGERRH